MARYTVFTRYVGGREGNVGYDELKDAKADFEDGSNDCTKVFVELFETTDEDVKKLGRREVIAMRND